MTRRLVRLALTLTLFFVAIVAFVYFKQHGLIYHPRPYDSTYTRSMPAGGVEIEYTMPFGRQVAFYAPPRSGKKPQRLWLAFCGNGSLALDWTTILAGYPTASDAFLMIDYPGYGKCAGYATIASMRASSDEALHALAKHLGIADRELEGRVSVIGHSLGAAAALDFAARHPVQRVMLVAPFTTLREEAALVAGKWLARLLIESYDNRSNLAELLRRDPAARVAIFHGTDDSLIPISMGRELSQTAPGRIDFFPVDGADHVSVLTIAHDGIIEWMNR